MDFQGEASRGGVRFQHKVSQKYLRSAFEHREARINFERAHRASEAGKKDVVKKLTGAIALQDLSNILILVLSLHSSFEHFDQSHLLHGEKGVENPWMVRTTSKLACF